MHPIKNKKGFTEPITMTILIVVSMASIYFIYGIFINLTTTQLSPAFDCSKQQALPSTTILGVCNNLETGNVEATLNRKDDSLISTLGFTIQSDTSSQTYECGPICGGECTIPEPGETKKLHFTITNPNPQRIIYSINDCTIGSQNILPTCN